MGLKQVIYTAVFTCKEVSCATTFALSCCTQTRIVQCTYLLVLIMVSHVFRMDFEESKDEGCCSINFLKYVLYMFNFVFMVSSF